MYICGSYREIITGLSFLEHPVHIPNETTETVDKAIGGMPADAAVHATARVIQAMISYQKFESSGDVRPTLEEHQIVYSTSVCSHLDQHSFYHNPSGASK